MKTLLRRLLAFVMILTIVIGIGSVSFAVDDSEVTNGSIIELGSYPQSEVIDRETVRALGKMNLKWKSYGYCYGDGTNAPGVDDCFRGEPYQDWRDTNIVIESDYMQYCDVVYKGTKYRAVYFTEYRPSTTGGTFDDEYSCQKENGYKKDTVYWFEFEPIEWRILDVETGLIMCETVIDAQAYCNTLFFNSDDAEFYGDPEFNHPAYDYQNSSIRKWLNETFYDTAFSFFEKNLIKTTELDNNIIFKLKPEYNIYAESTNDKVFILSYNDATNSEYGFSEEIDEREDANRCAVPSDYSKCQGVYVFENDRFKFNQGIQTSSWLLRFADFIDPLGGDDSNGENLYMEHKIIGIRPALCAKLSGISADAVQKSREYSLVRVINKTTKLEESSVFENTTYSSYNEIYNYTETAESETEKSKRETSGTVQSLNEISNGNTQNRKLLFVILTVCVIGAVFLILIFVKNKREVK